MNQSSRAEASQGRALTPTECMSSSITHLAQVEGSLEALNARLFGENPADAALGSLAPPEALASMASNLQSRAARINEMVNYILDRL